MKRCKRFPLKKTEADVLNAMIQLSDKLSEVTQAILASECQLSEHIKLKTNTVILFSYFSAQLF